MNGYYKILTTLKEALESDNDVNTVTQGDINEIDLNRKNIFNLAHIFVNGCTFFENTIQFNVTIYALALRDINKDYNTDKFNGNDNEVDNLNTTLYILRRLYSKILAGKCGTDSFGVIGEPSLEPLTEKRENLLDGWEMSIVFETDNNEMNFCCDG